MAWVNRLAWEPSLHGNSPWGNHSVQICKIVCVSTVNADTEQTVIIHQAFISKWTGVFHHYVHFHFCLVKKMLLQDERLVVIPQSAFLGHLRVNLRVILSLTHTHIIFHMVKAQNEKDYCRINLHGLQDLRPAVLSRCLVIYDQRSSVCSLSSVVCSLRSAVCSLRSAVCGLRSAVCGPQSVVCSL